MFHHDEPEDFVSSKVKDMPFSGIRKFFDVANEIEGVISLGVGEPDFDTPWSVRERAIYTLEKGKTDLYFKCRSYGIKNRRK